MRSVRCDWGGLSSSLHRSPPEFCHFEANSFSCHSFGDVPLHIMVLQCNARINRSDCFIYILMSMHFCKVQVKVQDYFRQISWVHHTEKYTWRNSVLSSGFEMHFFSTVKGPTINDLVGRRKNRKWIDFFLAKAFLNFFCSRRDLSKKNFPGEGPFANSSTLPLLEPWIWSHHICSMWR